MKIFCYHQFCIRERFTFVILLHFFTVGNVIGQDSGVVNYDSKIFNISYAIDQSEWDIYDQREQGNGNGEYALVAKDIDLYITIQSFPHENITLDNLIISHKQAERWRFTKLEAIDRSKVIVNGIELDLVRFKGDNKIGGKDIITYVLFYKKNNRYLKIRLSGIDSDELFGTGDSILAIPGFSINEKKENGKSNNENSREERSAEFVPVNGFWGTEANASIDILSDEITIDRHGLISDFKFEIANNSNQDIYIPNPALKEGTYPQFFKLRILMENCFFADEVNSKRSLEEFVLIKGGDVKEFIVSRNSFPQMICNFNNLAKQTKLTFEVDSSRMTEEYIEEVYGGLSVSAREIFSKILKTKMESEPINVNFK